MNVLTDREVKIMRLVSIGYTSQEIAANMYLSESTVKQFRSSVILKMKARNSCHAVSLCFRGGIIS